MEEIYNYEMYVYDSNNCKVYGALKYGIICYWYYKTLGVKNKGFMLKTKGLFDIIIGLC